MVVLSCSNDANECGRVIVLVQIRSEGVCFSMAPGQMVELTEMGTIPMTVIHVTQQLESDTIQLPELKPLIGKKVEITIREAPAENSSKQGWDALFELSGKDLVDPEAYKELRALDRDPWREDGP
jgi:hypothetical protein